MYIILVMYNVYVVIYIIQHCEENNKKIQHINDFIDKNARFE